jgi:acetyl-CoA acetyltransferase
MPKVSDEVVVVGVGETPVGKLPGMGPLQIQALAVTNALRDAGLTIRDVDGFICLDPYSTPNSMFSVTLLEYLGGHATWCSVVDVGGTVSAMAMLQQAAWAIMSGHCQVAVVVFGENNNTVRPAGTHGFKMNNNLVGDEEWEEPYGIQGAVIPYAMVSQRYIHETGATPEDLGEVALVTRRHALLNENAMMKKPMSMQDYLASRMVCTPLRLFDCSIPADGGGALVLASRERAKAMDALPVGIKAMAMKATHNSVVNIPDIECYGMQHAGEDVFAAASMGPADIDVALIHDAFTVSVLLTLEALGFAKPGEGGAYMRSGAALLGGRCPLNPHGGLLSQGHVGGILHLAEAVYQLRHQAGRRQVPNARTALVSGNGGVFSVCGAMIFERQ